MIKTLQSIDIKGFLTVQGGSPRFKVKLEGRVKNHVWKKKQEGKSCTWKFS